jgi:hypothetical protein
LGDEGNPNGEHLLLSSGKSPRQLVLPLIQTGKELKDSGHGFSARGAGRSHIWQGCAGLAGDLALFGHLHTPHRHFGGSARRQRFPHIVERLERAQAVNANEIFNLSEPDMKMFETFSENFEDKDQASPEWQKLKSLVGSWEGYMEEGGKKEPLTADVRMTGDGSAIMHTMARDTPMEMVTMIHPDGKRLLATHYCAAHNQPRMAYLGGLDTLKEPHGYFHNDIAVKKPGQTIAK